MLGESFSKVDVSPLARAYGSGIVYTIVLRCCILSVVIGLSELVLFKHAPLIFLRKQRGGNVEVHLEGT
jgi:hypothetical protein